MSASRLGWGIGATLLILALSLFYVYSNFHAPMQRDGAHFVFMANNIAHGQAPYWASFEPKNPLVELYWSPFLYSLGGHFGLVGAARIAEALWLAATAMMIFSVIASVVRSGVAGTTNAMPVALAAALIYLVLASDVRVTDDGFNIALYQSLPELALVAHLLRRPTTGWFGHGLLAGALVFVGWFVKQTSLVTDALVIAAWLVTLRDRRVFAWMAGTGLGALAGLGAFWLHLKITGTISHYFLAELWFQGRFNPLLLREFFANAKQSFWVPLWTLPLGSFLAAHRIWTTLAMVMLLPVAIFDLWRSRAEKWSTRRYALLLCMSWMFGAWLQAVLALTFFPHYFLASLAPVCTVAAILMLNSRPGARVIASTVAVLLVISLVNSYRDMREVNIAAGRQAPINRSTEEVLKLLKPGDKVFNWSGLPNVLVAFGAPSAYPLNMCWPYILTGLPESTRMRLLKETLADAPDVVIAMDEQYPANQGIVDFPMSAERLKELTGRDYVLVEKTTAMPGRYGDPVSVFRRL
ncbi:hypothetical protein [Dyella sp. 20L07]|uniref:hypothetical protein n=1 Tax=Dyella sp. 20L07 TaxID=3384240 RepID=UPI003D2AE4D2